MQLTYFFYGATVVRLLFPTFFVLLFLLADAKVSLSSRNVIIHAKSRITLLKKSRSKLRQMLDKSLVSPNKPHQNFMQAS